MLSDNLVDLTFGVKNQAWAVLHMLNRSPDFAEYREGTGAYRLTIETRLWLNCRESGFCLVMQHPGFYGKHMLPRNNPNRVEGNGAYLIIAWGEHRNTDDIFVQHWITDKMADSFNMVPVVSDCPESAYHSRSLFPYGHAAEAAQFIYDTCADFYNMTNEGLALQGYTKAA